MRIQIGMKWSHINIAAFWLPTKVKETIRKKTGFFYNLLSKSGDGQNDLQQVICLVNLQTVACPIFIPSNQTEVFTTGSSSYQIWGFLHHKKKNHQKIKILFLRLTCRQSPSNKESEWMNGEWNLMRYNYFPWVMCRIQYVTVECVNTNHWYSELMQHAPVFKGCWVPSPAFSASHKGLSSVGWEGMTLEDFGSVCFCVYAAGSPDCAFIHLSIDLRVRCRCSPVRMLVFVYDYIYVHWFSRVAWAQVCFLQSSHSGTLSSERCASQSAERGQQDLKRAMAPELGQKRRERVREWEVAPVCGVCCFEPRSRCLYTANIANVTSQVQAGAGVWQV